MYISTICIYNFLHTYCIHTHIYIYTVYIYIYVYMSAQSFFCSEGSLGISQPPTPQQSHILRCVCTKGQQNVKTNNDMWTTFRILDPSPVSALFCIYQICSPGLDSERHWHSKPICEAWLPYIYIYIFIYLYLYIYI